MEDVLAVGGINPDTANLAAREPHLAQAASNFTVHASYADYGPHLDVVAPTQVPTTEWGGGYRMTWDGTSAATPHVAGTAALVLARARALGVRLSAGEVMQIIRMTADDLADPAQGYHAGWDLLSGWGRVNAFAAVSRGAPGRIPPVADIVSPSWYRSERRRFVVRGIVTGRSATAWRLEVGRGDDPRSWRVLARGTTTGPKARRLARLDAGKLAAGDWTLRLHAIDAHGNPGEDRDVLHVIRDRSLKRGYPKSLGTSGEASPTLADVNGDGVKDVVLATAGGQVDVWSGHTGRELHGWPRSMAPAPGSRAAARRIGTVRAGFVGSAAVGDVAGGPRPEVIAAGRLAGGGARHRGQLEPAGRPGRAGLARPRRRERRRARRGGGRVVHRRARALRGRRHASLRGRRAEPFPVRGDRPGLARDRLQRPRARGERGVRAHRAWRAAAAVRRRGGLADRPRSVVARHEGLVRAPPGRLGRRQRQLAPVVPDPDGGLADPERARGRGGHGTRRDRAGGAQAALQEREGGRQARRREPALDRAPDRGRSRRLELDRHEPPPIGRLGRGVRLPRRDPPLESDAEPPCGPDQRHAGRRHPRPAHRPPAGKRARRRRHQLPDLGLGQP